MTDQTPAEPPTVGAALRDTLDAQAMSQVDLAAHTGLSTKHINQILQGDVGLSLESASLIGRATGIPAQVWAGIAAARLDWELAQTRPDRPARLMPKLRAQRDDALRRAERAEAERDQLRRQLDAAEAQPALRADLTRYPSNTTASPASPT